MAVVDFALRGSGTVVGTGIRLGVPGLGSFSRLVQRPSASFGGSAAFGGSTAGRSADGAEGFLAGGAFGGLVPLQAHCWLWMTPLLETGTMAGVPLPMIGTPLPVELELDSADGLA